MRSSKLAYLLIVFPVVFLCLYYRELVYFIRSVDPSVHPVYDVRCIPPTNFTSTLQRRRRVEEETCDICGENLILNTEKLTKDIVFGGDDDITCGELVAALDADVDECEKNFDKAASRCCKERSDGTTASPTTFITATPTLFPTTKVPTNAPTPRPTEMPFVAAGQVDRNSEVIEYEGQLYCCHVPGIQCSTSISDVYVENVTYTTDNDTDVTFSICSVDEFVPLGSDSYNSSIVYKPTPVTKDDTIKEPSGLFLYLAAGCIGFISIAAYVTNRKHFPGKTVNLGCFLAEIVIASMKLDSEATKVLLIGPYEALGTGSRGDGLTKWKGLLLVLSVTSEFMCDAFILCASSKRHLEDDYDKNTLEADGWNDESTIGARGIMFFLMVQLGCGAAYMTSFIFGCSDITSSGGLAITALVLCVIGCCCCVCMFYSAESREDFIFGSGFHRKSKRLVVSLFVTEIPGIMLNPEIDGLASLFITLLVYTSIEQVLDWFGEDIFCGVDVLEEANDFLDGSDGEEDLSYDDEDEEIGEKGVENGGDNEEAADKTETGRETSEASEGDSDEREYNDYDDSDSDEREYNDYDDSDESNGPESSDMHMSKVSDDGISPQSSLPQRDTIDVD